MGELWKKAVIVGQRDDFYTDKAKSVQDYIRDIRNFKPMSLDEERKLFEQYRSGDVAARDRIVESYQLFVYAVARQYAYGDNVLDLTNEGNIGLIEAIDKFNIESGNRFISYAAHYVKKNILYYLQLNSGIVKNVYYNRSKKKILSYIDKFFAVNGREPTNDELWELLPDGTKKLLLNKNNLNGIRGVSISESNMDDSTYETAPEFTCATSSEIDEDALFANAENARRISDILSELPPIERNVIKRLYGIGCQPETEYGISLKSKVSVGRIRQIKNKAFERMRFACRKKECRD